MTENHEIGRKLLALLVSDTQIASTKTSDRFHEFRSLSDNVFIIISSSFLLLAKGTLTRVGQLRQMNWVLVKNVIFLVKDYHVVKFINSIAIHVYLENYSSSNLELKMSIHTIFLEFCHLLIFTWEGVDKMAFVQTLMIERTICVEMIITSLQHMILCDYITDEFREIWHSSYL